MSDVNRWMSAAEAVEHLRLPSLGAIYKLVKRGKLPYTRLGRNIRFDRFALDKLLERASVKAA